MRVPHVDFLNQIEHLYAVRYPLQYREFCEKFKDVEIENAGHARFISDIETFWAVNTRVGEQQWGDYEHAIAGKELPKDKSRLWGEILPFFFDDHDVFGFSSDGNSVDQVFVWSVHTIVHIYPSLSAFMTAHLRV